MPQLMQTLPVYILAMVMRINYLMAIPMHKWPMLIQRKPHAAYLSNM